MIHIRVDNEELNSKRIVGAPVAQKKRREEHS